jgi:hypothetical protein
MWTSRRNGASQTTKAPAKVRLMEHVWTSGGNRVERRIRRTSPGDNAYIYRCFNSSGRLVFEANTEADVIFKYGFYFERGEL